MKKLLILASIAMVAMFSVNCGGGAGQTPSDVVDAYYSAAVKGDFEKALTYTTVTSEEATQLVAKVKGLGGVISSYEIISETVAEDGQSAVVEVKYSGSALGMEITDETTEIDVLKQEDGSWKIDGDSVK